MDAIEFRSEIERWTRLVIERAVALFEDGAEPNACVPLAIEIVGSQLKSRAPGTHPLIERAHLGKFKL